MSRGAGGSGMGGGWGQGGRGGVVASGVKGARVMIAKIEFDFSSNRQLTI